MDSGKAVASGVSYQMAPRTTENFESGTLAIASPAMSSERKKRGRPRKYKPDESGIGMLSPMSMSSTAPPASGKSFVGEGIPIAARPINSDKKLKNKVGAEKLDDWIDCTTGSSFLPHVLTVNTGEDISTKIMEFSLQGPRAVCVISGTGMVSNVTIRRPSSSGGTLTYEGMFEIISFSGSFTPMEMPDSKFGRSGMLTISLSGADGRVVGGLIAGLTVAASPVKVVVASFLLGSLQEPKSKELKSKKRKIEPSFTINASGPNGAPTPNVERRSSTSVQGPSCSTSQNPTNWAPPMMQTAERSGQSTADINISLQG
ncbi:hypothetical protein ACJIZ3_016173 [Penstemon smallii]|uniref:AT-hook motif nuclear-localized protein n=1 Tax=Penstemon smallii TaxID=265156 RepID=A0ABD3RUT8_9LAMI